MPESVQLTLHSRLKHAASAEWGPHGSLMPLGRPPISPAMNSRTHLLTTILFASDPFEPSSQPALMSRIRIRHSGKNVSAEGMKWFRTLLRFTGLGIPR